MSSISLSSFTRFDINLTNFSLIASTSFSLNETCIKLEIMFSLDVHIGLYFLTLPFKIAHIFSIGFVIWLNYLASQSNLLRVFLNISWLFWICHKAQSPVEKITSPFRKVISMLVQYSSFQNVKFLVVRYHQSIYWHKYPGSKIENQPQVMFLSGCFTLRSMCF